MKSKLPDNEKQAIINRYLSGEKISHLVQENGIARSTLYSWIKEYKDRATKKQPKLTVRAFMDLENKVKRLERIIEILKTVNCKVDAPLREKLYALEELYGKYSIHMLCEALEVSRGTFYNHILRNKRDNTYYSKRREELRIKIQQVYNESKQIFGAAKIAAVLKSDGYKVSERIVRELMRDMGLISIREESKSLYDKEQRRHKNYLNQQFDTTAPNQVWVSDVTYFRFNEKNYYICVIIDLYARMVVGYKIAYKNSTQLLKSTFKIAYENRTPAANLIFHTDRGANYRSKSFNDYLKSLYVTHSFSRVYVPYDNSVMESFFSSIKREELYRTKYRSEKEFRTAVDDYIVFYNERRPHRKNLYNTPLQKEQGFYDKKGDTDI